MSGQDKKDQQMAIQAQLASIGQIIEQMETCDDRGARGELCQQAEKVCNNIQSLVDDLAGKGEFQGPPPMGFGPSTEDY